MHVRTAIKAGYCTWKFYFFSIISYYSASTMIQLKVANVVLSLLLMSHLGEVSAASWSYDNQSPDGPLNWGSSYPNCKLNRQSPIDIVVGSSLPLVMPELVFSKDYHTVTNDSHMVNNNGHTIQLSGKFENMKVSGGGLPSTYRLQQLHMHWGGSDDIGSEHLIDGKAYPLEIHLVHYDEVKFKDIKEAMKAGTGLAVLGVMAKVGTVENRAFQNIIESLSSIKYADTNATFTKTFAIIDLLPYNHDNYFRYLGSLTTPPCFESVVWTVFQKPIEITSAQLQEFRKVLHNKKGEHDAPLINNFRPIQKLQSRTVNRSFYRKEDFKSSTNNLQTSIIMPVLMSVVVGCLKFK